MMENKRKKGTPPPRYDDAFKAGAVRMVIEQGRPSAEVAKELGICIDTLRSWLKAAGVQPGQTDRQNRDNRKMRDLEAEVRALRKQLAEKDEVIDILKKSVGILSKPQRTSIAIFRRTARESLWTSYAASLKSPAAAITPGLCESTAAEHSVIRL